MHVASPLACHARGLPVQVFRQALGPVVVDGALTGRPFHLISERRVRVSGCQMMEAAVRSAGTCFGLTCAQKQMCWQAIFRAISSAYDFRVSAVDGNIYLIN